MTDRSPLFAALAKAQAELRGVANDARNQHHRYTYTSAEALIAAVTDAIAPHGLAWVCLRQSVQDRIARCEFAIVHESGAELSPIVAELEIVPGKGRPGDKAALAAYTECHAYALRGAFNIPRAEPNPIAGRDDSKHEPAPMRRKPGRRQGHPAKARAWAAWKEWAAANSAHPQNDMAEMWALALNIRGEMDPADLSGDELDRIADYYLAALKPVTTALGDQLPIASEESNGADDGE